MTSAWIAAEEGLSFGPVPRPAHRRQCPHERRPVRGVRETRVEHGDDSPIGGGSDQASGTLGEQRRSPWEVDGLKPGPARPPPVGRPSRGRPGRGNGIRSMITKLSAGPGTSTPCQKLIVANRQAADCELSASKRADLGSSPCTRTGHGSLAARTSAAAVIALRLVNKARVPAPGG